MKAFIKDHFVLIAGISLPLVLSLVFFISARVDIQNFPPPQYSFVIASNNYNTHNPKYPYKFKIDSDGVLNFHYHPPADGERSWAEPRLYVFNPGTQTMKEIALPDYNPDKKSKQAIPDLKNKKLDRSQKSPDGYQFISEYRRGNLMTELFGGGYNHRYRNMLEKDGYKYKLDIHPAQNLRLTYDNSFIGWIVEE